MFLLGLFALGDVVVVDDDSFDTWFLEKIRDDAFDPAGGSVGSQQTMLKGHRLLRLPYGFAQAALGDLAVVGVDRGQGIKLGSLLEGVARGVSDRRAEIDGLQVGIDHNDLFRAVRDQRLETLEAGAERLLRTSAHGDVRGAALVAEDVPAAVADGSCINREPASAAVFLLDRDFEVPHGATHLEQSTKLESELRIRAEPLAEVG